MRTDKTKRHDLRRLGGGTIVVLATLMVSHQPVSPTAIGADIPVSFSVCETEGGARPECEGGDIRFQGDGDFGFSIASGHLNGDELEDLVIGDPANNRVYIFFGRQSLEESYGLSPTDNANRAVSSADQADVVLRVTAGLAGSFGFSVAIGTPTSRQACGSAGLGAPLAIGAPGKPGTRDSGAGAVFYIPSGEFCGDPGDPLTPPLTLDALAISQTIRSPFVENNDEFGYSLAFGRVLVNTGSHLDLIVGARAAARGAGRVTVFPVTRRGVDTRIRSVVRIEGLSGDGLGESLATGDLDGDSDNILERFGSLDDLSIGAVGSGAGKVILVRGPLSPEGGDAEDGVYGSGDIGIKEIVGEADGDYHGFSVAISGEGRLAVGAIRADNEPNDGELSNVGNRRRINAGKVYVWDPRVLDLDGSQLMAVLADNVFVARRSADELGFAVAFSDLDGSGQDDLVMTARREDGSGLRVQEIDQGTAYVVYDDSNLSSPVDLGLCATTSDCTGVGGVNVMIFGGDRGDGRSDELGFAVAVGDFNGDDSPDLFLSSRVHARVYAVSFEDTDEDGLVNLRDNDDDGDGDEDLIDCEPLSAEVFSGAEEITCNDIDENCNGDEDDRVDEDGDGFDLCGSEESPADCDDEDPYSYPEAEELCDGNNNACAGSIPLDERDADEDGYVGCSGFEDLQGDNPDILGGDDCDLGDATVFPGIASKEKDPSVCMRDGDGDGFGDADAEGNITPGTDCDDEAPMTFPGAAESENATACMNDDDEDGFGDVSTDEPVIAGTDCDDDDIYSFPGADERCDGNDNACSGTLADDETDPDADGFVECEGWVDYQQDNPSTSGGGDCVIDDATIFPGASPNEAIPTACTKDADGDDFGDYIEIPGVTAGTDCDDTSATAATTYPGAAEIEAPLNCMKDTDDDGFGDDAVSLPIVPGTDCADDDDARFPGAIEIPDDGTDQDCNGTDTLTCFVDDDGDGFGTTEEVTADDGDCTDLGESEFDDDCDDTDGAIFPGQEESEDDGIDQDCNGFDTITCFVDADGDGAGDPAGTTVLADDGSCDAEQNEAATDDDCDEADPRTFPGAPELCDGNDNDCDTVIPDDETDGDGDTYVSCSRWDDSQGDDPAIAGGGDCNDMRSTTFPGAAENESQSASCMKDADGDGFGDVHVMDGVAAGTDCDDDGPAAAATFPGAAPLDNTVTCMKDVDGDGFGDALAQLPVVRGTDCNDDDDATFAGAEERCDGNDNTCAGSIPSDEMDGDGDGFVPCSGWIDTQGDHPDVLGGGDCNDGDPDTRPGAAPNEALPGACMKDHDGDDFGDLAAPAGVTRGTDCDDDSPTAFYTFPGAAAIDGPLNCMRDVDGDDFGDSAASLPIVSGGDCNDADAGINPGVTEGPMGDPNCADSIDNDCDSLVDDDDPVCQGDPDPCPDKDGDDFADCDSDPTCDETGLSCGDCNDGDPEVRPGATETCDNVDNNCDDQVDEGFDNDDDGFTTCDLPLADCDDGNAMVNPGATELCSDGTDNDCNPATIDVFDSDEDGAACDVDCDDQDAELNLTDVDLDGTSTCDGDCNDADAQIAPNLQEACDDGKDNDCNPATPDIFDLDADGADCVADCDDDDAALNLDDEDDDAFSTCAGDCNDQDAAINPSALEECDGEDDNCDGDIDEAFDLDGDGYSTCDMPLSDCNDGDATISPGAPELCNDGIDNDCQPATPDVFDADGDGSTCTQDCDDADPSSRPGAPELCDGNDNACLGFIVSAERDDDGDGYVECNSWNDTQADNPEILGGGDCGTADIDTFPGAAPNESFPTACMKDSDGDDFGDLTPPAGVIAGTDCDDDSMTAPSTFPGAAAIDGPLNCMKDADGDDYGDNAVSLPIVRGTDCDDDGAEVNPGASEGPFEDPTCSDMLDNDCDTSTDADDTDCAAGPASDVPDEGKER